LYHHLHNAFYNLEIELSDEGIPVQASMILLRLSATRKLDYLMRCVDPAIMTRDLLLPNGDDDDVITLAPCNDHDQFIEAVFIKKLGLNLNSDLRHPVMQARLPVSAGGFGLVASKSRAAICYLSSLALAMRTKTALATFEKFSDPREIRKQPDINQRIDFALKDLRETQFAESPLLKELPSSCEEFFKKFVTPAGQQLPLPVGMQSKLTKIWNKQEKNVIIDALDRHQDNGTVDPKVVARLLATQAPGASAWITALPTSPDTKMNDYEYRMAAHLRLGVQAPSSTEPLKCAHICSRARTVGPFSPIHRLCRPPPN
jgi:hypothetical protein